MKLKKLLNYFKPKPWEKDAALILFFLAFISLAGFNIYDDYITTNAIKETKENYTSISETAKVYKEEGDKLYDLADVQYELENFTMAIKLCEEARKEYSEAEFQYAKAIVILKPLGEKSKKLIDLNYIKMNITTAKYEACEYFENSMINQMQGDYYRAIVMMNGANKKIELHDKLIRDYRLLAAELELSGVTKKE